MIPFPQLPLAAGLDWLEAILPILFVGFWVLSQIVAIFRRIVGPPAEKGRASRPAAPQPPVVRRVPPRADGEPRPRPAGELQAGGDLQREIREFLERTSSPPAVKPVVRPPRPVAPAVAQMKHSQPISSIAEKVQADFAKELKHLSSPLTSEPLAGDPSLTGARATAAADGRARAARDIGTMLRSPATLRQLVVLREILDRPVDRW